jgi:hypothetical protein
MFRVVISEALFHKDIRDSLFENIISKVIADSTHFINEMASSGQIRTDIEPMNMIRSVVGNFMVFIVQKMLFTDNFNVSDSENEIDSLISIIMDGISPQSGSSQN